ncbi:orotate phosphoribosyltransferase [Acidobacteria bacterium AH-259-D05]|nr:orotate phosphoribosyltransferase [Acidobacteria bacterium AH-259-D05]
MRDFAHQVEKNMAQITGRLLWHHQAIEVSEEHPFRLASGDFTPVYINCRRLISFPQSRHLLISFLYFLCGVREIKCDCVAGGETAGIPFGAWLAERLDKPFIYVRKKPKDHGEGRRLEGVPTGRVLLVEDLLTDGGSKIGFIEGIREAGCSVSDCLVLVDREQNGVEKLAETGVNVHSLVGISTCLEVGQSMALLSQESLAGVRRYLEDPAAWQAQHGLQSGREKRA